MRSELSQLSFLDGDNQLILPKTERPLDRLELCGSTSLSIIELIAIIIGSGMSDLEALNTAYTLLSVFGSSEGVVAAETEELAEIRGIGRTRASQLKAAVEFGRRVLTSPLVDGIQIQAPVDAANLFMADMQGLEQEHLRVMLLNTRNIVMGIETVYIGNINTSVIRVGELFKKAIRKNAASIIVAHNHPSGDPTPSSEDIRVTRALKNAGELMNISVYDHVIIGKNRFVSLKERGLGFD